MLNKPTGSVPITQDSNQKPSVAERLNELNELRAKGLITEEEFKQKREEILRGL
jgi:cytochrome c-type biogenesis protein CcmH/NrfG